MSEPERNLRIFFLSAWEALILTKAFGWAEAEAVSAEAWGEDEEEEEDGARRGGSCWGHTSPPSSESLDRELEAREYTSLMLDSDSPGAALAAEPPSPRQIGALSGQSGG